MNTQALCPRLHARIDILSCVRLVAGAVGWGLERNNHNNVSQSLKANFYCVPTSVRTREQVHVVCRRELNHAGMHKYPAIIPRG